MDSSAYEAIYTGVYIFIFIIALTVAIVLFNSITNFADLAYEFTNRIDSNSTIVQAPVEENLLLDSNKVLSYYYNYIQKDLYGDGESANMGTQKEKYKISIYTKVNDNGIPKLDSKLEKGLTLEEAIERIGINSDNNKYILTYDSKDEGSIDITIKKATQAQIESFY